MPADAATGLPSISGAASEREPTPPVRQPAHRHTTPSLLEQPAGSSANIVNLQTLQLDLYSSPFLFHSAQEQYDLLLRGLNNLTHVRRGGFGPDSSQLPDACKLHARFSISRHEDCPGLGIIIVSRDVWLEKGRGLASVCLQNSFRGIRLSGDDPPPALVSDRLSWEGLAVLQPAQVIHTVCLHSAGRISPKMGQSAPGMLNAHSVFCSARRSFYLDLRGYSVAWREVYILAQGERNIFPEDRHTACEADQYL